MRFAGHFSSVILLPGICSAAVGTVVRRAADPYEDGGLIMLSKYDDGPGAGPETYSAANLLDGTQPKGDYASQEANCKLLGETLWDISKGRLDRGLSESLFELVTQGMFPADQLYWVMAGTPNNATGHNSSACCAAMDAAGLVSDGVPCNWTLPALCSQSAPVAGDASGTDRWKLYQKDNYDPATGLEDYVPGVRTYYLAEFADVGYAKRDRTGAWVVTKSIRDCYEAEPANPGSCAYLTVRSPYLPREGARGWLRPVHVTADEEAARREHCDVSIWLDTAGEPVDKYEHLPLAVQWLKENIDSFGGNASDIRY